MSLSCLGCGASSPAGSFFCAGCGAALGVSPSLVLPQGARLLGGVYLVVGVLGQGGFGITYAATDVPLQRKVAIKEFFPLGSTRRGARVVPGGNWGEGFFEEARRRFQEEGQALARFKHPAIVPVYAAFNENDTTYIVMEHLEGRTVAALLEERGGSLPVVEAVALAVAAGEALEVVHRGGLLHRDVKPANLMVTTAGNVVLVDFGSAREFAAGVSRSHTVVLTPGYAPLEQYSTRRPRGPYTDVYSLAATLYHMLTGVIPAEATDRAQGDPLSPVRELRPAVGEDVDRAVMAGLAMDPAERPQEVRGFLDMLGASRNPLAAPPARPVVVPAPSEASGLSSPPLAPAASEGPDAARPAPPQRDLAPTVSEEANHANAAQTASPTPQLAPTVSEDADCAHAAQHPSPVHELAPTVSEEARGQGAWDPVGSASLPATVPEFLPAKAPAPRRGCGILLVVVLLLVGAALAGGTYWVRVPQVASSLAVKVKPPSARVTVDGTVVGTGSRLVESLAAGRHTVTVDLAGYASQTVELTLGRGEQQMREVRLVALPGDMLLDVVPDGVDVLVDGHVVASDARNGARLQVAPGRHAVVVRRRNFEPYSTKVVVKWNAPVALRAHLESAVGALEVDVTPKGSRVLVDGKPAGATPFVSPDLAPRAYRVRVEREGYRALEETVTVKKGGAARVTGELRTWEQVRAEGRAREEALVRSVHFPVLGGTQESAESLAARTFPGARVKISLQGAGGRFFYAYVTMPYGTQRTVRGSFAPLPGQDELPEGFKKRRVMLDDYE